MTRRRTDGERIVDRVFYGRYQSRGMAFPSELAIEIDRLIRKRMGEAWDEGNVSPGYLKDNPYRKRKRK
jgi:hypothetical protein